MNKIIFIRPYMYTVRDWHRFGAEYLEQKGYSVELWTVYEQGSIVDTFVPTIGHYLKENWKKIRNKELQKEIKQNKESIFIYLGDSDDLTYLRLFNQFNIKYVMFEGMGLVYDPCNNQKPSHKINRITYFRERIFWEIKSKQLTKIVFKTIFFYLSQLRKKINKYQLSSCVHKTPPVCIVCATRLSLNTMLPCYRKANIIFSHTYDYDRYLEQRNTDRVIAEKYALFIDSAFCFQNMDSECRNENTICSQKKEEYLNKLNKVFDILENKYDLEIIIAGHPHTIYPNAPFGKRKFILNQTESLVKNAEFVIMQMSTAISYVVLYDKPILVLINELFKDDKSWYHYTLSNCRYFKIEICNLDIEEMMLEPWKYISKLNPEKRDRYSHDYIRENDTPEQTVIEILEQYLLNNNILERQGQK